MITEQEIKEGSDMMNRAIELAQELQAWCQIRNITPTDCVAAMLLACADIAYHNREHSKSLGVDTKAMQLDLLSTYHMACETGLVEKIKDKLDEQPRPSITMSFGFFDARDQTKTLFHSVDVKVEKGRPAEAPLPTGWTVAGEPEVYDKDGKTALRIPMQKMS